MLNILIWTGVGIAVGIGFIYASEWYKRFRKNWKKGTNNYSK